MMNSDRAEGGGETVGEIEDESLKEGEREREDRLHTATELTSWPTVQCASECV